MLSCQWVLLRYNNWTSKNTEFDSKLQRWLLSLKIPQMPPYIKSSVKMTHLGTVAKGNQVQPTISQDETFSIQPLIYKDG